MTNGEIKIEAGVPMPGDGRRRYPFHEMEVGDSFFVPHADKSGRDLSTRVSNAAVKWGKIHDCKFTIRQVDGGARCWRVS